MKICPTNVQYRILIEIKSQEYTLKKKKSLKAVKGDYHFKKVTQTRIITERHKPANC